MATQQIGATSISAVIDVSPSASERAAVRKGDSAIAKSRRATKPGDALQVTRRMIPGHPYSSSFVTSRLWLSRGSQTPHVQPVPSRRWLVWWACGSQNSETIHRAEVMAHLIPSLQERRSPEGRSSQGLVVNLHAFPGSPVRLPSREVNRGERPH